MEQTPNGGTKGGAVDGEAGLRGLAAERSASIAVIEAVAESTKREATELPPLYETVDPDALDALFTHRDERSVPGECRIEFRYAGYDVIVRDGPRVSVRKR